MNEIDERNMAHNEAYQDELDRAAMPDEPLIYTSNGNPIASFAHEWQDTPVAGVQ